MMRLSINERVVKSRDVTVSTPRMVDCNEGFQQLGAILTVLSVDDESQDSPNSSSQEPSARKANPIEVEAEAKAALIIKGAENRGRMILEEAGADSDRLRQEVVEAARNEVYPAAQAEGYQAGLQAGEAEGKRLTEKASQLIQLAQRAVQEEYAKVDEDLLHLAIKIAERIVRSSLAVEPRRLLEIIKVLTLLPQERVGWKLHVASDDASWLEGDQLPCPWVVDKSLNPGDCFLECQEGIFDARIEAQLDKLEHILREELENGGLEAVDANGGQD